MESVKESIVKKEGRKRGMPLKKVVFSKERNDIIIKLEGLLGLSNTNRKFVLADLDNNVTTQNEIIKLDGDIKKYFSCGNWPYFMSENGQKRYISLVKSIYKDMGYDLTKKAVVLEKDGYFKNTHEYEVIKK